jgi:ribosomal protein S18 acetylase RimI-like enzyme
MTDFTIELLDAEGATAVSDDILAMYRAAFSVAPWNQLEIGIQNFEKDIFPRHLRREGFAITIARNPEGGIIGFCYGYIGEHGQYWTDYVAARIHPSLEKSWLGGHFEVAELAVDEHHRGQGVGRALLTALLDSRGADRIALQTMLKTSPALKLYHSLGFSEFGAFEEYVVLGLPRSA